MIREFQSIIGTKVLDFETGEPLALVNDIIINPDNGAVEGFWVKPITIPLRNAIIQVSNILEFKKHIYIKDDSKIAVADDVIRISDILAQNRLFIGNKAQNEKGDYIGKIVDVSFDTKTFMINQLLTQKSFLGIIHYDKRIFSYNSIVKVLSEAVIINDESTKKETILDQTVEPVGN